MRDNAMRTRLKNQRGAALIETAITLPIILLVSVGIFEFGRAFQTWQVLTNAAREGARIAILSDTTDEQVRTAVKDYMRSGGLSLADSPLVDIGVVRNVPMGATNASNITITYPFSFIALNPVVRLVSDGATTGESPISMSAVAIMRNEN